MNVFISLYYVSSQSPVLERRKIQFPQSLLIGQSPQFWNKFCGALLDPLQKFNVLLESRMPYYVSIFQAWSHYTRKQLLQYITAQINEWSFYQSKCLIGLFHHVSNMNWKLKVLIKGKVNLRCLFQLRSRGQELLVRPPVKIFIGSSLWGLRSRCSSNLKLRAPQARSHGGGAFWGRPPPPR